MSYRLKLNGLWQSKLSTAELARGGARMVTDILNRAKINAPYKDGPLRNSGKFIQRGTTAWRVQFGGGRVPYAYIREHVNHLHPNKTYYLKRATEAVAARYKSYFNLK